MKKVATFSLVLVLVLNVFLPVSASALEGSGEVPPPKLLITEFTPGWVSSSDKEFVEIYNASDNAVTLQDWKLFHRDAQADSGTDEYAALPDIELAEGARVVLVTESLGLSDKDGIIGQEKLFHTPTSGGLLTLGAPAASYVASEPIVGHVEYVAVDRIAWGKSPEAKAEIKDCAIDASAPSVQMAGMQSYKRLQNPENSEFIDGAGEVCLSLNSTPGVDDGVAVTDIAPPEPEPEPEPNPDDNTPPPDDPNPDDELPPVGGGMGGNYLAIEFSELLIDPATPQTDDKDEFIELYNPHGVAVDLDGYKLQSGTAWQTTFGLDELRIPAKGYLALKSAETPISLTNSGGQLRLVDPDGNVIETLQYPAAKSGEVWMKDSGQWVWSAKPTPDAANEKIVPLLPAALGAAAKASSTKKAAAAKKPAAAKKASATKPKAAKTTKKKADDNKTGATNLASTNTVSPNYWLLGGAGALAAGYGAYEYRQDIGNAFRRLFRRGEES